MMNFLGSCFGRSHVSNNLEGSEIRRENSFELNGSRNEVLRQELDQAAQELKDAKKTILDVVEHGLQDLLKLNPSPREISNAYQQFLRSGEALCDGLEQDEGNVGLGNVDAEIGPNRGQIQAQIQPLAPKTIPQQAREASEQLHQQIDQTLQGLKPKLQDLNYRLVAGDPHGASVRLNGPATVKLAVVREFAATRNAFRLDNDEEFVRVGTQDRWKRKDANDNTAASLKQALGNSLDAANGIDGRKLAETRPIDKTVYRIGENREVETAKKQYRFSEQQKQDRDWRFHADGDYVAAKHDLTDPVAMVKDKESRQINGKNYYVAAGLNDLNDQGGTSRYIFGTDTAFSREPFTKAGDGHSHFYRPKNPPIGQVIVLDGKEYAVLWNEKHQAPVLHGLKDNGTKQASYYMARIGSEWRPVFRGPHRGEVFAVDPATGKSLGQVKYQPELKQLVVVPARVEEAEKGFGGKLKALWNFAFGWLYQAEPKLGRPKDISKTTKEDHASLVSAAMQLNNDNLQARLAAQGSGARWKDDEILTLLKQHSEVARDLSAQDLNAGELSALKQHRAQFTDIGLMTLSPENLKSTGISSFEVGLRANRPSANIHQVADANRLQAGSSKQAATMMTAATQIKAMLGLSNEKLKTALESVQIRGGEIAAELVKQKDLDELKKLEPQELRVLLGTVVDKLQTNATAQAEHARKLIDTGAVSAKEQFDSAAANFNRNMAIASLVMTALGLGNAANSMNILLLGAPAPR